MLISKLQETYSNGLLDITVEQQKDGTTVILFAPKKGNDLNFAITQANKAGLDLIKSGQIRMYNSGVIASINGQNQVLLKIYLVPNKLQLINNIPVNYSSLFYSTKPHIEEIMLDYSKGSPGCFLETEAYSNRFNSPTKFFEEFGNWNGYLLDSKNTLDLFNIRSLPITNIESLKLSNKEIQGSNITTFSSYIQSRSIKDIDWLCLNEVGEDLDNLLIGLEGSGVLPKIISLVYEDNSLSDLNNLLSGLMYKLDKVYYQYAFFVRTQ